MARRLSSGATLVLASHNKGKVAEFIELLSPFSLRVVASADLGLTEPEEEAHDFVGNARLKALAAAKASGLPALADDSGFCLAALGGAPGIHSARWAGPNRDFAAAMQRVQAELGASTDRRAWFACALALAWPNGHTETFFGRVEGIAVWPPRGDQGFGYDPMFCPLGEKETYGEMAPARKRLGSHRARAFAALARACLPEDAKETHALLPFCHSART